MIIIFFFFGSDYRDKESGGHDRRLACRMLRFLCVYRLYFTEMIPFTRKVYCLAEFAALLNSHRL